MQVLPAGNIKEDLWTCKGFEAVKLKVQSP